MRSVRSRALRALLTALLLVTALAVAACGSTNDDEESSSSSSGSTSGEEALASVGPETRFEPSTSFSASVTPECSVSS